MERFISQNVYYGCFEQIFQRNQGNWWKEFINASTFGLTLRRFSGIFMILTDQGY